MRELQSVEAAEVILRLVCGSSSSPASQLKGCLLQGSSAFPPQALCSRLSPAFVPPSVTSPVHLCLPHQAPRSMKTGAGLAQLCAPGAWQGVDTQGMVAGVITAPSHCHINGSDNQL